MNSSFLRFIAVGLTATLVHYIVALSLSQVFLPYLSNIIGFLAAFGVSYLGHLTVTFRISSRSANHSRRLPAFLLVAVSALALSQLVLVFAIGYLGLPDWQALLAAVGIAPIFTYAAGRWWVFRKAGGQAASSSDGL